MSVRKVRTGVSLASNGDYWTAIWRDGMGQRVRKGIGSKAEFSRRAAQIECDRIAAENAVQPQRRDLRKAPTLTAWLDRYPTLRTGLAGSTLSLHRETIAYLKRFPKFKNADTITIDRITRSVATDWRTWLTDQPVRPKDGKEPDANTPRLSEASVCRHVRTAKVIFAYAGPPKSLGRDKVRGEGLIAENPFDHLDGHPGHVEKDWKEFTEAEIDRLIDAAPSADWKALLGLVSLAGLRLGEALRLKWSDIQWDRNRLVVLPLVNASGRRKKTTKQGRREVRLEPKLAAMLLDCRELIDGELVAPVFRNNLYRTFIGGRSGGKRYAGIIAKAGFTPWSKPFHTLRKWRATSWRALWPEHVVDAWLGHSLEVAREHYASVPEEYFGTRAQQPAASAA